MEYKTRTTILHGRQRPVLQTTIPSQMKANIPMAGDCLEYWESRDAHCGIQH